MSDESPSERLGRLEAGLRAEEHVAALKAELTRTCEALKGAEEALDRIAIERWPSGSKRSDLIALLEMQSNRAFSALSALRSARGARGIDKHYPEQPPRYWTAKLWAHEHTGEDISEAAYTGLTLVANA